MMFKLVVAISLLAASLAVPLADVEWEAFKTSYNKPYEGSEETLRKEVFTNNLAIIERHNAAADRGEHTYWLGVNEYADLTLEEFKEKLLGTPFDAKKTTGAEIHVPTIQDLPDSVDWRTKGYVTPIKNQQQCGSCWAFSATGSLEGQHFKSTGKLVSLSEQNLVDCSKPEGNQGCQGGLMDQAFTYVKKNGGIDTEDSYPYRAKNQKCAFKKADVGATVTGFKDIQKGSETALEQAVAEIGPISVAIDAGHNSFQLYKRGVYNERACSSTKLDHGVLAVGYGTEGSDKYWLVKNSWGTSWGQEGYIFMSREKNNQCGIATAASYPLV